MASGAVVTLQSVTYGKHHRFVYGTLWQRLAAGLTEGWFRRFGGVVLKQQTTNECAVAWLVWKGKPGSLMTSVPMYVVVNEDGKRVPTITSAKWQRVGNDTLIDGRELVLPRYGKTVRLRLYELDENSKPICVGEFSFRNPARSKASVWTPEPLPIRRTNHGVEIILVQLTAEEQVRTNRGFATPLNTLTFRVFENGRPSTNWQLRSILASDALGNRNHYGVYSHAGRHGEETWTGSLLLWPEEPAWKLEFQFARRGGFSEDELWHVRGIAIPGRAPAIPPYRTNLQGITLVTRGITDASGLLSDGEMSVNATSNVLDIQWSSGIPGLQVSLLEVHDATGNRVKISGSVGGSGSAGYQLSLGSAATVDAIIAVRRSRFFELIAKPTIENGKP